MNKTYILRFYLTVSILSLLNLSSKAQTPGFVNVQCGNIQPHHMVTDVNGNIIVTGMLIGNIDFNPTAGISIVYSNGFNTTLYLAKYNASGTILWAFGLPTGGSTPFNEYPTALQVDASGNIYVAGIFNNNGVDMDPGPAVQVINTMTQNTPARFFAKYSAAGAYIYAYSMGNHTTIADIAIDQYANLFLTGTTDGVDVAPNSQVVSIPLQGSRARILTKIDSAANYHWAKTFTQSQISIPPDRTMIELDQNGNLVLAGQSSSILDFDPDTNATYYLGSHQFSIAKYDSINCSFIMARSTIRGAAFMNDFKIDNSNNMYITGSILGVNVDFNPDTIQNVYLTTNGLNDMYLGKYDSNGNYFWVKSCGSNADDIGLNMELDQNNHIYISGIFDSDSVDFDPGPSISYLIKPDSLHRSIYHAVYDSSGQHIKSFCFKGVDLGEPAFTKNALGLNNDLIVTGNFQDQNNTIDFDPGPGVVGASLCSTGAYILKFGTQFLGVTEINPNPDINVFPNPVSDQLKISLNSLSASKYALKLIDLHGKTIWDQSVTLHEGTNVIEKDVQSLPAGMYFLLITNTQFTGSYKILKM